MIEGKLANPIPTERAHYRPTIPRVGNIAGIPIDEHYNSTASRFIHIRHRFASLDKIGFASVECLGEGVRDIVRETELDGGVPFLFDEESMEVVS